MVFNCQNDQRLGWVGSLSQRRPLGRVRSQVKSRPIFICGVCCCAALKMEKLKENAEQMKQGKESAEEKIKTMSSQLLSSFQQYRDGFDDILERNKTEFEETKRKLEDEIKQLRQQVC